MACSLTRSGLGWVATAGSSVTVKVLPDGTTLTGAKYNNFDIPVQDNSITFTVAHGVALLLLSFLAPSKSVEVVEACSDGNTQSLFTSQNEIPSILSFQIIGNGGGPISPEEGRPPMGRPK